MILCFRCTAETRSQMDQLIAAGSYRGYAEAIEAAVRNLVMMEQEVTEKGSIIIESQQSAAMLPPPGAQQSTEVNECPVPPSMKTTRNGAANIKPASHRSTRIHQAKPGATAQIPGLFRLDGFPSSPPAGLADLPGDMWGRGQVVPLDRWVLGQYNRLLPAKANARALVRLFIDSPKGLTIAETAATIAADAAALGTYLRQIDDWFDATRDGALATAFPAMGKDSEKSRARYANQFVVYQNGKGELSGLMVDFKLINVVAHRRERLIVPTQVAWDLAVLENPALDGQPATAADRFSFSERSLLLQHVVSAVPVEACAYGAILTAVRQGNNRPETIDAALRTTLPDDRADKLSQSFLASQRSGAVSRMADLGLIERQREGTRVSYTLSAAGNAFLAHRAEAKTQMDFVSDRSPVG